MIADLDSAKKIHSPNDVFKKKKVQVPQCYEIREPTPYRRPPKNINLGEERSVARFQLKLGMVENEAASMITT